MVRLLKKHVSNFLTNIISREFSCDRELKQNVQGNRGNLICFEAQLNLSISGNQTFSDFLCSEQTSRVMEADGERPK